MAALRLRVDPALRPLLHARHRVDELTVPWDGTSSLGHVVESLGVPLTEVGGISRDGDVVAVRPVPRPQPAPHRFVLDVHLGTLARRLRLLGVDTAYRTDAADPELVAQATAEDRVLLTQDRGLLKRRALRHGAYVRGARPADQLADVLDRFNPPLAPYTRCGVCNGVLAHATAAEVAAELEPGTRRSYADFSRCTSCGRVYWRGAHAHRLDAIVRAATARP